MPNNIPGKGLYWPYSWRALMEHYNNDWHAVADAVGITRDDVKAYETCNSHPRNRATRRKFLQFGWGCMELPPRYHGWPNVDEGHPVGKFWSRLFYSDPKTDGARQALADLWKDGPKPPAHRALLPIARRLRDGEDKLHDALVARAMRNGHTDWSACELATDAMERFSVQELHEMLDDG